VGPGSNQGAVLYAALKQCVSACVYASTTRVEMSGIPTPVRRVNGVFAALSRQERQSVMTHIAPCNKTRSSTTTATTTEHVVFDDAIATVDVDLELCIPECSKEMEAALRALDLIQTECHDGDDEEEGVVRVVLCNVRVPVGVSFCRMLLQHVRGARYLIRGTTTPTWYGLLLDVLTDSVRSVLVSTLSRPMYAYQDRVTCLLPRAFTPETATAFRQSWLASADLAHHSK
jgi:hypothetical protein